MRSSSTSPRRSGSSIAASPAMRRSSCASPSSCTAAAASSSRRISSSSSAARERFNFTYLPEDTEALLKEAFACFTCRLLQRLRLDVPARRAVRIRRSRRGRQARTVRRTCEHPPACGARRRILRAWSRKCCSTSTTPGRGNLPEIDAFQAGVLLEVLKDLLYQAYVRRGRLQQAMMVRRYFSEDSSERHAAARRASLNGALSRPRPARSGTSASSHCPRPRPRDARNSAPCGIRAPGAASGSRPAHPQTRSPPHPAASRSDSPDRSPRRDRDCPRTAGTVCATAARFVRGAAELGPSLAVRDCDRQPRSRHAREEERARSRRSRPSRAGLRTAPSGCAGSAASARRPGSVRPAQPASGSHCRRRA